VSAVDGNKAVISMDLAAESSFGNWLKQRRQALDLTQLELAKVVGCSEATIQKIEVGKRKPSKQIAQLIAENIRVTTEERSAIIRFARTGVASDTGATISPMQGIDGAWTPVPESRHSHRPLNNLAASFTTLIGREEELQRALDSLLGNDVRLLTLTGPPGVGKTRLALQIAEELVNDEQQSQVLDGVFFVALAPVYDPELVTPFIAQALAVRDRRGEGPFGGLVRYLKNKQFLLVLDNFEQILDAAPTVIDLLSACPHLKALVTSREPLHERGEHRFPVPPLALPDPAHLLDLNAMRASPSVALFEQRAQAVEPTFAVTEENRYTVEAICALLEGLPLAIELAAARTSLLSLAEIEVHLRENRLSLLGSAGRHLSPKQQTLRGAIDWSYSLLDRREQTLFRRLAVFVGGCTLAAAEAVCVGNDAGAANGDPPLEMLYALASLVDKNLLQRKGVERVGERSESRYAMLETVHEYAAERLERSDEAETTRRLHAEYYLAWAEVGESMLHGPDQTVWLDQLQSEQGNLRAALAWSLAVEDCEEVGLRLAVALHDFWWMRGQLDEGHRWTEALLARSRHLRTITRARALLWAGWFARFRNKLQEAATFIEESLGVFRELDDAWGIAYSLQILGMIAQDQGDYSQALTLFEEGLARRRQAGDEEPIAYSLLDMGTAYYDLGEYTRARELYTESLLMFRAQDNKWAIAQSLAALARVAFRDADYERAKALCNESLIIWNRLGDGPGTAQTLATLGRVLCAQGDYAEAHASLGKALWLYRAMDDQKHTAICLVGLAGIAYGVGRAERAVRLCGAAEALSQANSVQMPPSDRLEYGRMVAATRSELEQDRFTRSWQEGRAMSTEQAIEYALQES
jgi:predicted ATPase/DNA-binding XRE family transcriptional regulator